MHIQEKAEGIPEDEEIATNTKLIQQVKETLAYLKLRKIKISDSDNDQNANEVLEEIKNLRQQYELKNSDLQSINKEIYQMEPWGQFSWNTINNLKNVGYHIHFFSCNKSKFKEEWKSEYNLFEIGYKSSIVYFIIVSSDNTLPSISSESVSLPKESLEGLIEKREQINQDIDEINNFIRVQ